MADGVSITPGSGATVGADEVTGLTPSLTGASQVQYIKIVDGTVDSTNKLIVDSNGRVSVNTPTGGGKTLLFGVINTSVAGDNTLAAAPGAGLKIKVVSYALVCGGSVSAKFTSGAAGANLTGPMPFAANTGIALAASTGSHLFEVATNTALVLNLSAATQVSGHYSYFVE